MNIKERIGLPLAALTASSLAIAFATRGEAVNVNDNDVTSPNPAPTPEMTVFPQVSGQDCTPFLRWGEKGETPGMSIVEEDPNKCVYTMILEDVKLEGDEGSNPTIPFALAGFGLATLAGGVWAVSRTRRENL